MPNTINAITTGIGGLATTADNSGAISLQSAGSTVVAVTSGGVAVTGTMTVGGNAVLNAGTAVTIPQGGTGQTTASAAFNALSPITTTGDLIIGNGTNSATRLAIGSNNTVLTSNGTTATWAAAGGGALQTQVFTAPGTWTRPSTVTQVRVTVVGGGGGGGGGAITPAPPGGRGGAGGYAKAIVPVSSPVSITIGSGGSGATFSPSVPPGSSGGTSSFGALVSATGGGGGGTTPASSPTFNGADGTGTVSTGTALRTTNTLSLNDNLCGGAQVTWTASTAAVTYSITGSNLAGGAGAAGLPAGPPFANSSGNGGVSGAVVVEWVG